MSLTLLIDLDDTLLGNGMETFIPAYLGAMGKHLETYFPPRQLSAVMMAATENMFRNTRPDRTLKQAFDPDFYPQLGVTEAQISTAIEQFYCEVFPDLQNTTQLRPEALEFIEAGFQQGWEIIIATNPLFPHTAIQQRLDWAGLGAYKDAFAIIPSYETFHFAKPNPAFFAEILSRIGWPREATVMVGNDPDHDIRAAQAMGIPTFWISNGLPYPPDFPAPSASGNLSGIIPWIEATPPEQLQPDFNSPAAIMATLSGIPAGLLGLTSSLTNQDWQHPPEDTEWSLTEIACHLRDVEREVNLPRLKELVQQDTPFIPGIDSDTWAQERDYASQDGLAAQHDFVTARQETIALLSNLSPADWKRPAHHAIFGPTDLQEIANIIGGHDRLHIRQVYQHL